MAGASLIDWPLSYEDILPYYEKAEAKMGIAGRGGRPQLPGNNNFKVMQAGAKRIGYTRVHTGYMAINSVPYDDRPACRQIGFCMQAVPSAPSGRPSTPRSRVRRRPGGARSAPRAPR